MSGTKNGRRDSTPEWLIAVEPDRVVPASIVTDDADDLDWNLTTLTMTLQGSLQSGYDLSDAIESAATFYRTLAHRDRHSNRDLAKQHAELADRMAAIAAEMEQQLNVVLNATPDAMLNDERSRNKTDGDEHDER